MSIKMKFYTAGYGNRQPNVFFGLLKKASIRTLVDVRHKPVGRLGCYTKTEQSDTGILKWLTPFEITYAWIKEFGNPFHKDRNWKTVYPQYLEENWDAGYSELLKTEGPACLMCGHMRVEDCHRAYIVKRLESLGHLVEHF